jgi:hypothetical protein
MILDLDETAAGRVTCREHSLSEIVAVSQGDEAAVGRIRGMRPVPRVN